MKKYKSAICALLKIELNEKKKKNAGTYILPTNKKLPIYSSRETYYT